MFTRGDQVFYKGHLFWVWLKINLDDGQTAYLIRQSHWPDDHFVYAFQNELALDVPFTA